jgi:hypothetical protein
VQLTLNLIRIPSKPQVDCRNSFTRIMKTVCLADLSVGTGKKVTNRDKVFITYDLAFPKDKPHTGQTPAVAPHNDTAEFDFTTQVMLEH